MAIASLLLTVSKSKAAVLSAALAARADIVERKELPDDEPNTLRLALVLECPSSELSKSMRELNALPGVLALNFVFANYEDDLDEQGHMPCDQTQFPDHGGV